MQPSNFPPQLSYTSALPFPYPVVAKSIRSEWPRCIRGDQDPIAHLRTGRVRCVSGRDGQIPVWRPKTSSRGEMILGKKQTVREISNLVAKVAIAEQSVY